MTGRECGSCSLCCKVLRIAELDKPKDAWCPNFKTGAGCTIYADRPPSCRSFNCRWLVDPALGPEWKPSLCKMVLDTRESFLVVHVDPAATRPWRAEPYLSTLRRFSVQGLPRGGLVLVIERQHNIVILPDREVDLGVIAANARIGVERVMTPNGPQWRPRVLAMGETGRSGSAGGA